MSHLGPGRDPGVIRITPEEAVSPHVDDLLKRQASLRGEGGITRDRKSKWYLQNWFVFMLAGAVAAFLAWAVLEPYYDDMLYVQGPIEDLNIGEDLPLRHSVGGEEYEITVRGHGWVEINGAKIWILSNAKSLWSDGHKGPVDPNTLWRKRVIGVYVLDQPVASLKLDLAQFVVPDPPSAPPKKASMSLEALAAQSHAAGMVLFAVVASFIGLAVGSADGILCRVLRRALLAGGIGLAVGFIGGFVSGILANLVYGPLSELALKQHGDAAAGLTTFGFLIQMGGRALGWAMAGMAMGLGQGIALRSGRLLLYGLLGGVIGGVLGGLLFDPVDLLLLGMDKPSAHWSRMIGIVSVGAGVGAMIGVVELLARDAWLRMVEGPLAGKEFVIFKDAMNLGSSPRSDIYLFNDDAVEALHGTIRSVGDNYELENRSQLRPILINGRPVQRSRLHHGDQISIGRTVFTFERRKG